MDAVRGACSRDHAPLVRLPRPVDILRTAWQSTAPPQRWTPRTRGPRSVLAAAKQQVALAPLLAAILAPRRSRAVRRSSRLPSVPTPLAPTAPADKAVDELPIINWVEASETVSGGDRDDAFLLELLVTFYHESVPHLRSILEAALAYRAGVQSLQGESGYRERSIEAILKEEAHALKGSAANLRLWRLAKVRVLVSGVLVSGVPARVPRRCGAPPSLLEPAHTAVPPAAPLHSTALAAAAGRRECRVAVQEARHAA